MKKYLQQLGFILCMLVLSSFSIKAQGAEVLTVPVTAIQFSLYPQPTTGILNISFTNTQSGNVKVQLFDMLGNMVGSYLPEKDDHAVYSLDISDKKPGYYFVKIQCNDSAFSRRITVMP